MIYLMNVTFIINNMELDREQFVKYLCEYIDEYNLAPYLRNVLPNYTVLQNVMHHPVRIAREIGLNVTVKHH